MKRVISINLGINDVQRGSRVSLFHLGRYRSRAAVSLVTLYPTGMALPGA